MNKTKFDESIILEKAFLEETKLLNDPYSCTFVFKNIGSRSARNLKSKVYLEYSFYYLVTLLLFFIIFFDLLN